MCFEWDENKNKSNIEKHGIDFEIAKLIFEDKKRKTSLDNRKEYGEERFKTVGKIYGIIMSVVYTYRNAIIRIISARKAGEKERDEYNK